MTFYTFLAALPTDWTKMTPEKLRTPKSKPLKTILMKASGDKGKFCNGYNKYVLQFILIFRTYKCSVQ